MSLLEKAEGKNSASNILTQVKPRAQRRVLPSQAGPGDAAIARSPRQPKAAPWKYLP